MWLLSDRYRFRTLTPEQKNHNEAAIRHLYETPLASNVWLSGLQGRGKTHLAHCTLSRHLRYWMRQEPFADTHAMCAVLTGPQLRQIGDQFAEDREADIYRLGCVRLLLVDDADKCAIHTMKPLEVLWSILDFRHRRGLRTIVTSNMTGEATRTLWAKVCVANPTLPGAIMDRLQPCRGFEIKGPASMRATHAPIAESYKPVPGPMEVEPMTMAQRHAVATGNLAGLVGRVA